MYLSLRSHFLFYGSADHRDLHSFPTRRSSDLHWPGSTDLPTSTAPVRTGANMPVRSTESTKSAMRDFIHTRSEEHTSELQSLTNLVCRLLLEKKKKKKLNPQNNNKTRNIHE